MYPAGLPYLRVHVKFKLPVQGAIAAVTTVLSTADVSKEIISSSLQLLAKFCTSSNITLQALLNDQVTHICC